MNNKSFGYAIYFIVTIILFNLKRTSAQCNEQDISNLKKIAIVFGEKNYKYYGDLKNPENDANDISDSLRKVGFNVFTYLNKDLKTMTEEVDAWNAKLKDYDVALFYFSGHGAEVNGSNYLFPVDANPKGPSQLSTTTFSANQILATVEDNINLKYSIIILDACRNNPFTKSWNRDISEKGLATMSAKGAFIAFAASPGYTASDGEHRNGTYTEAILKYITVPNLNIDEIFTKVNAYVKRTSVGDQAPFKSSSLGSDYCFSVTRKYKPANKVTGPRYQQPNSCLLLSRNEQFLFTADPETGVIAIRDAFTLSIISSMNSGLKHPAFIVTNDDNIIYAADSLDYYIKTVDLVNKKLDSIKMIFLPTAMYDSQDGKRIYISGNNGKNGFVSVVDVTSKLIHKTIPIDFEVGGMTISPDGKRLYLVSKTNTKSLIIIDLKSERIVNEIKNFGFSGSIAVSRDNQRLYFYNINNQVIDVLNSSNFVLIKTIPISASNLSFTNDGKNIFTLNEKKLSKITYDINEVLYDYILETPPNGVVTTSDGHGFAWLPKEKYLYEFQMTDSTKSQAAANSLELKFQKFRKALKNDKSMDAQRIIMLKQKDSCDRKLAVTNALHKIIVPIIQKIIVDLENSNFEFFEFSAPYSNCPMNLSDFHNGIRSKIDPKYSISSDFRFQFLNEEIVMTIFDEGVDKAPIRLSLPTNAFVDNVTSTSSHDATRIKIQDSIENKVKKFVKEYFYARIDELNHEHKRQF